MEAHSHQRHAQASTGRNRHHGDGGRDSQSRSGRRVRVNVNDRCTAHSEKLAFPALVGAWKSRPVRDFTQNRIYPRAAWDVAIQCCGPGACATMRLAAPVVSNSIRSSRIAQGWLRRAVLGRCTCSAWQVRAWLRCWRGSACGEAHLTGPPGRTPGAEGLPRLFVWIRPTTTEHHPLFQSTCRFSVSAMLSCPNGPTCVV